MSRADFRDRLQTPLIKALENKNLLHFGAHSSRHQWRSAAPCRQAVANAKIRYARALLWRAACASLRIPVCARKARRNCRSEFRRNEAAVDSELACLPVPAGKMLLAGPRVNPFFGCTNAALLQSRPTAFFSSRDWTAPPPPSPADWWTRPCRRKRTACGAAPILICAD